MYTAENMKFKNRSPEIGEETALQEGSRLELLALPFIVGGGATQDNEAGHLGVALDEGGRQERKEKIFCSLA